MPRKARCLIPGCPHHIVQRGHNRRPIFVEERDFVYYLENLCEFKAALKIRVYAWCLMKNHVHLIVEPEETVETISRMMKHINGRQTAYVNKMEGRSGTLWNGRYKASPIQREKYMLACIRYVEINPVRAGMVRSVGDYRWSSFHDRAAQREDSMLDQDLCYRALGEDDDSRFAAYTKFIEQDVNPDEVSVIRSGVDRNQLTGTDLFADEIEHRIGLRIETRGRGRPSRAKK